MNNDQLHPVLEFDEETNKGTLFDTRDGQTYKVVKIGNQIWLAENFRYLTLNEKDISFVYDNNNKYLEKGYGRLYNWETAKQIAPTGWHLPTNEDLQELINFIIKDNNLPENEDCLGSYLKSVNDWKPCGDIVNTDKYGFNAKPAGCFKYDSSSFIAQGENAYFYSATEYIENYSYYYELRNNSEYFNNGCTLYSKALRFSVRLIKDNL